jgi:hypothetical protein
MMRKLETLRRRFDYVNNLNLEFVGVSIVEASGTANNCSQNQMNQKRRSYDSSV